MMYAALPYYVYATSQSVTASGLALISEILPGALLNSVGGVYADRFRRKPVMALGNGLRGLIILPLLAVHGPSTFWIVYLTGFASASVAAFAGPFGSAALPHIVPEENLPAANAAFSVGSNVAVLLGSPLGGLLLQRVGLSAVVMIDAFSFLVPTITISLINVPLEDRSASGQDGPAKSGGALREWAEGWRYLHRTHWMFQLLLVAMLVFLGIGLLSVVMVPFVRHVLHGSPQFYSWVLTVQAASTIASGTLVGRASKAARPVSLVAVGLVVLGLLDLIAVSAARQPVLLATTVLSGFPVFLVSSNLMALFQSGATDAFRGRVYGTYATAIASMSLSGSTLATLLTDHLGIRLVFAVAAILFVVGGVFVRIAVLPS